MMRNAFVLVLAGCTASATLPRARFANAPPVYAVNDRLDVTMPPKELAFATHLYNLDGQFIRPVTRPLELKRPQRALGINALDEVPDSTWFTNRIGSRYVSPEELAAAPGGVGNPEAYTPWTVLSTKPGGASVGFVVADTRGERFLMKFDVRGEPEAETATHIIVGKLMWGFGLNVTEDYIAHVRRDDFELAPDAVVTGPFGNSTQLTRAELDRRLSQVHRAPDGTYRVLASRWLPGEPLGGHPGEGVRADDPNDLVPHELRRDLRGLYALFAWLDQVDVKGANMLDVYVEDPQNADRHYVKHYWIDYGKGLGYSALTNRNRRHGYEWYLDFGQIVRSLFTLGAYPRAWEPRQPQTRRGLGMLETTLYDPGAWKSSTPAYVPIYAADRVDKFWASKIIIRFTRDHIRAAVDAAELSDPAAAAWLVDALIERQRATAKYWFERVNPLDRFVPTSDRLCFDDLSIIHAFATAATTRYTLTAYTTSGTPIGTHALTAGSSGVTCGPLALAVGNNGYTIVRIDTKRPHVQGSTYVHLARDPVTSAPRVIGIWRP